MFYFVDGYDPKYYETCTAVPVKIARKNDVVAILIEKKQVDWWLRRPKCIQTSFKENIQIQLIVEIHESL